MTASVGNHEISRSRLPCIYRSNRTEIGMIADFHLLIDAASAVFSYDMTTVYVSYSSRMFVFSQPKLLEL